MADVKIDLPPVFWSYLNCELSKPNIDSTLLSKWKEAFASCKGLLSRSELGQHVEYSIKHFEKNSAPQEIEVEESNVYLQLRRTEHPNIVDLPFNLGHGLVLPLDSVGQFGVPLHLIPFLVPHHSFQGQSCQKQSDFPPIQGHSLPIQPQGTPPRNFQGQHSGIINPLRLPIPFGSPGTLVRPSLSDFEQQNISLIDVELPNETPYKETLQNLLKSCGPPLPVGDERPWPNPIAHEAFKTSGSDSDRTNDEIFLTYLRNFSSNVGAVVNLINIKQNLRSFYGLYPAFGVVPHPRYRDKYKIVVFVTPRWDPHMKMGVACPIELDCALALLSLQTSECHPLVSYLRSLIPLDVIAAIADLAATRRVLRKPITLILQDDQVKGTLSFAILVAGFILYVANLIWKTI